MGLLRDVEVTMAYSSDLSHLEKSVDGRQVAGFL